MDASNKLVPAKFDSMFYMEAKSDQGKLFKNVSKDVAEKCKSETDADKYVIAEKNPWSYFSPIHFLNLLADVRQVSR